MDWSEWIQNIGGNLIDKAATARFVQPYELQKLELEALGQGGYYREGQAGTSNDRAAGQGINPTVLLIGGVLLAFVLLRD